MVVDDTVVYRRIVSGVIEAIDGATVVATAPNGKIALDKLRRLQTDLILLDVEMPEMDGLATLKAIKSDEKLKDIPVMMVTTETSRTMIVEAIKIGAANYVCKPFTQEELTTKMVESLGMGF